MEFCLLGPLVVRSGGNVLPIPQGKQRVVLAVLLARAGYVVPADELIEIIWDGQPPPSARVTLQNYVKRLRQAVGEAGRRRIRTEPPGYLIELMPGELDVARFSALCRSGQAAARQRNWGQATARLGRALSLWRGQPFTDLSCSWLAVSELPRLTDLRATALEDRINADLHLGRHRQVTAELLQLACAEPLRERVHTMLMVALYRSGRKADALAAYRAARQQIVAELGLEPGAELRQLHQQILVSDPRLDLRPAAGDREQLRQPDRRLAQLGARGSS